MPFGWNGRFTISSTLPISVLGHFVSISDSRFLISASSFCPLWFLKIAPQTRRTSFPKVVIERDFDSEPNSSEDEEGEEDEENQEEEEEEERVENDEGEEDEALENKNGERKAAVLDAKKKGKAPITISLKKVCKVCKKAGHEAGFKGATYIDCPMKPCFLCKMPSMF